MLSFFFRSTLVRDKAAESSAQAQLTFAQNDYNRIEPLLVKHYVTTQQVDQARTAVRVAEEAYHQTEAQILQAQAQESMSLATKQAATASFQASQSKLGEAEHTVDTLETLTAQRPDRAAKVPKAELNLQWCYVRAPFDGYVANMNISQGAYAHVGMPMFTLIDTSIWWVLASYRESKLKRIQPGMHVQTYLMEHPGRRFNGVVDSVGHGAFPEDGAVTDGLPNVDRSLNWVHLSARFPVRIRITDRDTGFFRIGATLALLFLVQRERPGVSLRSGLHIFGGAALACSGSSWVSLSPHLAWPPPPTRCSSPSLASMASSICPLGMLTGVRPPLFPPIFIALPLSPSCLPAPLPSNISSEPVTHGKNWSAKYKNV
jgi:multidrug resistance efflux pump